MYENNVPTKLEEEEEKKKWKYGNKSAKSRHRSEIETLGNERRGENSNYPFEVSSDSEICE